MCYWFAEYPGQPEVLRYSSEAMSADRADLEQLVREVSARVPGDFPRTDERRRCKFCVYRSLCWEDVEAGRLAEVEELEGEPEELQDVDWSSVAPIPY